MGLRELSYFFGLLENRKLDAEIVNTGFLAITFLGAVYGCSRLNFI